jgi:hypothetical protein
MHRRLVALASTAILLLTGVITLGSATVAQSAPVNDTKVAGQLITGPGVQLNRDYFNVHEGNKKCGDAGPETVSPSSSQNFCYTASNFAGVGAYDTELWFRYKINLSGAGASGYSGYAVEGHVLVPWTPGTTDLSCVVVRLDPSLPGRNLTCTTSTVNGLSSRNPEPHWTVNWYPSPQNAASVYFLGDSVTAGFGYCGVEGNASTFKDFIKCGVDQSMANGWIGNNSLQVCQPVDKGTVDDRCSDNNERGKPWDAGPWVKRPGAPTIAYPYVIAGAQNPASAAAVYDWAMTGSTPANWDTGGAFNPELTKIKDSYVVMTLGANPLLSDYVEVWPASVGQCASSTIVNGEAAPPYLGKRNGIDGVVTCFGNRWLANDQGSHLRNIYKALLDNGNHVVVLGYPAECPWSFGTWQPLPNVFVGPAQGMACTSKSLPTEGNPRVQTSQWDQAQAIIDFANANIKNQVNLAGEQTGKSAAITFAVPDGWASHQPPGGDSWVFLNDTWVHPNTEGHKQLANTVVSAMCTAFKHWCGNSAAPTW